MTDFERYLITVILTVLASVTLVCFVALLIYEEPPEKDWCRDEFGTERPLEMCDD